MIAPKTIASVGEEIAIAWEDGEESYLRMDYLRSQSPSAENQGEPDVMGNRIGGTDQTEYPGVTVTGWKMVGGYAVQFEFSDGHATGLYSYAYLRDLGD